MFFRLITKNPDGTYSDTGDDVDFDPVPVPGDLYIERATFGGQPATNVYRVLWRLFKAPGVVGLVVEFDNTDNALGAVLH
jgi:hypothetical protein